MTTTVEFRAKEAALMRIYRAKKRDTQSAAEREAELAAKRATEKIRADKKRDEINSKKRKRYREDPVYREKQLGHANNYYAKNRRGAPQNLGSANPEASPGGGEGREVFVYRAEHRYEEYGYLPEVFALPQEGLPEDLRFVAGGQEEEAVGGEGEEGQVEGDDPRRAQGVRSGPEGGGAGGVGGECYCALASTG